MEMQSFIHYVIVWFLLWVCPFLIQLSEEGHAAVGETVFVPPRLLTGSEMKALLQWEESGSHALPTLEKTITVQMIRWWLVWFLQIRGWYCQCTYVNVCVIVCRNFVRKMIHWRRCWRAWSSWGRHWRRLQTRLLQLKRSPRCRYPRHSGLSLITGTASDYRE